MTTSELALLILVGWLVAGFAIVALVWALTEIDYRIDRWANARRDRRKRGYVR